MKRKILLATIVSFIIALMVVIPNVVFAEDTMSDEFKKVLNEEGKLVINSIPPKTLQEAGILIDDYTFILNGLREYGVTNYNTTFTEGDLWYKDEKHRVEIVYNYDKDIKTLVEEYTKEFPTDRHYFKVSDLEIINYWVNIAMSDSRDEKLANYSGELKSYLEHNNFVYNVDVRGGSSEEPFGIERIGIATLKYNDTYYFIETEMGVRADYIMYVPDETENTPDEMVKAAQKRIDDYLTGEFVVELTYEGTAEEFWLRDKYEETREDWQQYEPNLTFEEWRVSGHVPARYEFSEMFEDQYGIANINEDDIYVCADVNDGHMGDAFNLFIRKDSSKMVTPTYETADLNTNIKISSSASSIPLDTNLEAEKLTSGEEYERIIEILDTENAEVFDLNLYSSSLEKYIRELDNGTFEVKIPVPDNFKGKDLTVYYVGTSGQPEVFKVELEDEYAVFTTNHFSIYTLVATGDPSQEGNVDKEEKPPVQNQETIDKAEKDDTPKTGSVDIIRYILVLAILISTIGIVFIKRK